MLSFAAGNGEMVVTNLIASLKTGEDQTSKSGLTQSKATAYNKISTPACIYKKQALPATLR